MRHLEVDSECLFLFNIDIFLRVCETKKNVFFKYKIKSYYRKELK